MLDEFDQRVLEESERLNAQTLLQEIYGWEIGKSNAEKQRAGIVKHLHHKETLEPSETPSDNTLKSLEINGETGARVSTRIVRLSEMQSVGPLELMKIHEYDPTQWKLKSSNSSLWGSPENNQIASKIEVLPLQDLVTMDTIAHIFDALPIPDIKDYIYPNKSGYGLEWGIVDFHLGKGLSLEDEVELFRSTVLSTLGKIDQYGTTLSKMWFQVGQDFLHVDNSNKTTTHGTQMETVAPWSDIYSAAEECLLWLAEHCREICPIEFIYIPGNHDATLSYALASMLDHVYQNSKNVTVDKVNYPRKYREHGLNAFGLSHGREESKRIETKFQEEAPELLARTIYREFHLGDLHHEESYEKGGIVYRRLPTVTDLDGWHIQKGYKAFRRCTSFLWNPEGGKDTIEVLVKV